MKDSTSPLSVQSPRAQQDPNSDSAQSFTLRPPVDIYEDSLGIKVVADLPGVSKDGLDVRVHDHNLFIEALSEPESGATMKLHHAELRTPRFSRSFSLSTDFDPLRIDASLKDGVLIVSIPRREEAKPRRIEVQAG